MPDPRASLDWGLIHGGPPTQGRSLIETTGSTRFTITGRAERDGYTVATVATVEWFEEEVRPQTSTPI